jgi:Activator of Hsp90 ATPase homolog 1-like protein
VVGKITGDLRPGGEFHASLTSGWEGISRVEECQAPRRLLLTMDLDDPDEIEVMLTANGDQTDVVIEQRDVSLDYLAAFGAGMQVHAEDLGAHLAGRDRCDMKARWGELIAWYKDLASKNAG